MTLKTDEVKSDKRDVYPPERLRGGSGANGLTHWVRIAAQGRLRSRCELSPTKMPSSQVPAPVLPRVEAKMLAGKLKEKSVTV